MSTIELRCWNSTTAHIDQPDRVVLDLDPDPALPWKAMAEVTQLTLLVLDELGLQSFLRPAEGRGSTSWCRARQRRLGTRWSRSARPVFKLIPKLITDRFSAVIGSKNCIGKIFIDYQAAHHPRDEAASHYETAD